MASYLDKHDALTDKILEGIHVPGACKGEYATAYKAVMLASTLAIILSDHPELLEDYAHLSAIKAAK